ncbi:MAG TPA: dynamin family protein [Solirubrobacteraceae bacterium]|nr:dynamin family protein [Solirubrobacteraceae bacterium]
MDDVTAAREWTLAAVEELLALTEGLLSPGAQVRLVDARDRMAGLRFNLVVLGEFKRGKSSLVNALLGRDLLSTGVVPLTSVVTVIGAGADEHLQVRFSDGHEERRSVDELSEFVTETRNPDNRRGVAAVRVELDHELLWTGLELVDTPGIGSIHRHNTEVAHNFMSCVDAALCVLDAGQPLSEAEREFLAEVSALAPRMMIVVNKIDHLSAADQTAPVSLIAGGLEELMPGVPPELFSVSAQRGDGVRALFDRLGQLAVEEGHELLVRSVANTARACATDAAQTARFEANAIRVPLEELASRAAAFEARISELQTAGAEAAVLLEGAVSQAVTTTINEPLIHYARRERGRLLAALDRHLAELPRVSARELATELERWIDETVRGEFLGIAAELDGTIADELTELELRYARRVEEIVTQVHDAAENIFGVRPGDLMPATGPRAPSRFSFKLKDAEHALDILAGFGRRAVPGALGRRLVVREAEGRLVEMADRHAGRLRSELAHRVLEAARGYRRELGQSVKRTVEAIRAAIDRAIDDQRRGEVHTRARLEQLVQIETRCKELARALEDGMNSSCRPASPCSAVRWEPCDGGRAAGRKAGRHRSALGTAGGSARSGLPNTRS